MSLKSHLRWQIEQCHWITLAYLQDLTDAELLIRAVPGMNHAAWQLGHMIAGSKKMIGGLGQPAGVGGLAAGRQGVPRQGGVCAGRCAGRPGLLTGGSRLCADCWAGKADKLW